MSITFFIARREPDGTTRMAYRCNCSERWCNACDAAFDKNEQSPEMYTCADCTDVEMNLANQNAMEFIHWLGINADYSIPAPEMAALCRRRLWDEKRNHDPAKDGDEYKVEGGPRVIIAERRPGYLREKTEIMLRICEKAGDRLIAWG
jgi:hypothetical protein